MAWEGRWRAAWRPAGPGWRNPVRRWLPVIGTDMLVAAQAALAATAAWLVAFALLHNRDPVFAPTIAVGAVVSSQGRRLRKSGQLVGGVVLGVAVGDLLIITFGTGSWQVGVSVLLAVGVAAAARGGSTLMIQAGSTAVLLATLSPGAQVEFPRFLNAVVGAAVGLAVVALFLPVHPLRAVRVAASPALSCLAGRLRGAARALQARDAAGAHHELERLQEMQPLLNRLNRAVEQAREAVTLAPIEWRYRGAIEQYADGVEHMERMFLNCHPILRRTETLVRDDEPVPDALVAAASGLGDAVSALEAEFEVGRMPGRAREVTLRALRSARHAYIEGVGFSGSVLVAQVRTAATDLLRATGVDREKAISLVRQAAGEPPRPESVSSR